MSEVTENFAKAVKDYCRWAETEPKSKIEEATVAIRLLANLYFRALALPKNGPGKDVDGNSVSDEVWEKMFHRFRALPFNYYSDFYSPAKVAEEKPVTGDLADDLADIYRDIKKGLDLYETGHVTEALWDWNQSFHSHWGRHATSALHALHAYTADEDIDL